MPFRDHELVELAMSLPDTLKLRGWTTKRVLREAMKTALPAEIIRRPKMGFPVPLQRWFQQEFRLLIDEYVLGSRALARGLFEARELQRIVREHQAGVIDHSDRLWALVNLEIWQRLFLEQESRNGMLPQMSGIDIATRV